MADFIDYSHRLLSQQESGATKNLLTPFFIVLQKEFCTYLIAH